MRGKLLAAVSAALVAMGWVSSASATLLVDFKPQPSPNGYPEVNWTAGQQLVNNTNTGSGFLGNGNGDGALTPDTQLVGGLAISTPVQVTGSIPGMKADSSGTSFYDVTLKLTGLTAKNNAVNLAGTYTSQDLNDGTFEIWSSSPASSGAPTSVLHGSSNNNVLLLAGTIHGGNILGPTGGSVAFFSSSYNPNTPTVPAVTYTEGAIYDAIHNLTGFDANGSLSWSLLNVSPALGTTTDSFGNVTLNPLGGDVTGLFSIQAIPEPASLTLVMLGGVALMVRHRRNQRSR